MSRAIARSAKRLTWRKGDQRRARWLRAHPLCVACKLEGYFTPATEVDHIVPLAKGGADDLGNLQSLCHDCHDAKTRRDFGQRERAPAIGVDGWPI